MSAGEQDTVTAIVEGFAAEGRNEVSLDELAVVAEERRLGYGELESLIDALESAGILVGSPAPTPDPSLKADLVNVLEIARSLRDELGRGPTPQEIAERSGLDIAHVRRVLRAGAGMS